MHPYATGPGERKTVYIALAVASLGLFFLVTQIPAVGQIVDEYQWVSPPSLLTLYGLLVWSFDRALWKHPPASWFLRTPDLDGRWVGTLTSEHDDGETPHEIEVRIEQRWLGINVELEAEESASQSEMAAFSRTETERPTLTYQYRNEPGPLAREGMHAHIGTARLRLEEDGEILRGRYYSGRDRGNVGAIRLRKVTG